MRALRAGLILLLLLLAGSASAAEGWGLSIAPPPNDLVETDPGQVVTVGLRVVNTTDEERDVAESLELPSGWAAVTPPTQFVVRSQGVRTRLVGVRVPADAAAGLYEIRYRIEGSHRPDLRDEQRLSVNVRTRTGLTLSVLEQPPRIVAGQEAPARLWVENTGNEPVRIDLEAGKHDEIAAVLEPATLDLAAGEGAEVSVRAEAVRAVRSHQRHALRIVARSEDGSSRAGAVLWVPVFPASTSRVDLNRRVPVTASLYATHGLGRTGLQPEIAGTGPLDAAERYDLEVLLRGPDAGHSGTFGRYDEYRATLGTPLGTLRLGDQVYGVSDLVEPGRYGRGAQAVLEQGPVEVGVHHVQTRFEARPMRQTAATATLGTEHVEVGANLLHKRRAWEDGEEVDTFGSLEGTWRPWEDNAVSLEVAADHAQGADSSTFAWRLDATGRKNGVAYTVQKTRAPEGFRGYYRDTDLSLASVSVPLSESVSAQVYGSHHAQNLSIEPGEVAAPRQSVGRAQVRVRAAERVNLEVGAEGARGLDAVARQADWLEGMGRLALGWGGAHHNVRVESRVGRRLDFAEDESSWIHQHTGTLMLHPLKRQTVGLYGSWDGGSGGESMLFGTETSWGAWVDWEPVDDLVLDLRGERSLRGRQVDQVDASARYTWGSEVTTGLRVRMRDDKDPDGPAVSAMAWISVPLGVPVGRRDDVGAIRGRVVDADHPDRPGLEGVLVRADGAAALTDARGRFALGPLEPGTYTVQVDPAGLGMTRVATEPLPRTVSVDGGEAEDLTLAFAEGAALTGRLEAVGDAAGAGGSHLVGDGQGAVRGGLGGVRIEVASGEHRLHATTGADGRFTLRGLPPGTWSVRVRTSDLPRYHELEDGDRRLVLQPGETREATFRVRPRIRAIKMLQPAEVAVGATPVAPDVPRPVVPERPTPVTPETPAPGPAPESGAVARGEADPADEQAPFGDPGPTVDPDPIAGYDALPVSVQPSDAVPECYESIGCLWVFSDEFPGPLPTDTRAVYESELWEMLADPAGGSDHGVSPAQ